MKPSHLKKVLGLALSERSLLVAQLAAGPKPRVERMEEFVYPVGVSTQQPAQLGAALAEFLAQRSFSCRAAVVGIPLKWLVVRRKEVPAADAQTVINMLRLQAESEFSAELDLVCDFAGSAGSASSVLLMATQRKHIESATAMCEAAKLTAIAVTPTALALGEATGQALSREVLVLAAGPAGSEFSSQSGRTSREIRHLRAPEPQPPFISELRRTVSTLAAAAGSAERELVLWDGAGLDAESLGQQLGLRARFGDLPELGVDSSAAGQNGAANKYAPAVALALAGLAGAMTVDFLHSRLAPPKERKMPQWATVAAVIGAALIICFVGGYFYLGHEESELARLQASLPSAGMIASAQAFVDKASFAQAWHGGQPRYVACLRDLTAAIPEDGQTYATGLMIKETPLNAATSTAPGAAKPVDTRSLSGQLVGKTSDQERAQVLVDRIQRNKAFKDVRLDHTQNANRDSEVSFLIIFTYVPAAK